MTPPVRKPAKARARIALKRAYAAPDTDDGLRVLVDQLWPRGLSKDAAKIDVWAKDVAPSTALRRWFHHDPSRWDAFQRKYRDELAEKTEAVADLQRLARKGRVTLIFAAKDTEHNNAVVLKDVLTQARRSRA
jgi:uncharacterized protein YeaO (DUF488 family)